MARLADAEPCCHHQKNMTAQINQDHAQTKTDNQPTDLPQEDKA
jgi:hypothetical protein